MTDKSGFKLNLSIIATIDNQKTLEINNKTANGPIRYQIQTISVSEPSFF